MDYTHIFNSKCIVQIMKSILTIEFSLWTRFLYTLELILQYVFEVFLNLLDYEIIVFLSLNSGFPGAI